MNNNISSYTSASIFPIKVLKHHPAFVNDKKILPYHVQLNPTNVCNLKCSFCSCQNRSKTDALSLSAIKEIMNTYKSLGCRAVTITGGGEPLLHPDINKILRHIKSLGIKIGLVTNGTVFKMLTAFDTLTWVRISSEDTRDFDEETLMRIVLEYPFIDWAFSHVLSSSPNMYIINKIVQFANAFDFTHVRLVSDLLNTKNVDMDRISEQITADDSKVIYQGRKTWTKGAKKCLISLLKPVIGADGGIYPCCGAQYAHNTPKLDLHSTMLMGNVASDIWSITDKQKRFDGSSCVRCYYSEYNDLLESLTTSFDHEEFV